MLGYVCAGGGRLHFYKRKFALAYFCTRPTVDVNSPTSSSSPTMLVSSWARALRPSPASFSRGVATTGKLFSTYTKHAGPYLSSRYTSVPEMVVCCVGTGAS